MGSSMFKNHNESPKSNVSHCDRQEYKVRKYGFHGTSHKYINEQVAKVMGGKIDLSVVSAHLGNGCRLDLCAINL